MSLSTTTGDFLQQEASLLQPIIGGLLVDADYDLERLSFSLDEIQDNSSKALLKAIKKAKDEGYGRDIVQVVTNYKEAGFEQSDITSLLNSYYSNANIEVYIKKYKEYVAKRNVLRIGNELMIRSMSSNFTNEEVIGYANGLLDSIVSTNNSYDVGNNVNELYNYLEDRKGKELFGFSFGKEYQFLDKATRGIQGGRTYRIGALSNMGKSQMIYGVINNLLEQGAKVAFFSLENDKEMTMSNIVANAQRVNSWDLESGKVELDLKILENMDGRLFIIDDTHELSEVMSKVITIKPDVVILDYIGLITINKIGEDGLFTEYSKRVQQFVKKTRVAWIDLSNLPIGIDDNQILVRGQFYGSSYLKNNADVGIHLMKYEDFYKAKEMQELSPTHQDKMREDLEYRMEWAGKKAIKIAITKNRIGPAGLDEDYFVNFAEGGRFNPITPDIKLKFKPN